MTWRKIPDSTINLINDPEYAKTLADLRAKLKAKLSEIGENDLGAKR